MENNFDDLIDKSNIIEGNEILYIQFDKKVEYSYLIRFYDKSTLYFNDIFEEFQKKRRNDKAVKLLKVTDLFLTANKEFDIDCKRAIEIFRNNFKFIDDEYIELEDFIKFFRVKRKIQIKIYDFCESTLNIIINIFKFVENILEDFLNNCREMSSNCLGIKDFETVLLKLIPNFENKWLINEYFK